MEQHHPTVKPLVLMEYLCKLTKTPTGGVVLDPFCGSGTTCMACVNEGREYIGIEKDPGYVEIARRRAKWAKEQRAGQMTLFETPAGDKQIT
jgi:site-specific DNA-methyltransferase (adenine-specific)